MVSIIVSSENAAMILRSWCVWCVIRNVMYCFMHTLYAIVCNVSRAKARQKPASPHGMNPQRLAAGSGCQFSVVCINRVYTMLHDILCHISVLTLAFSPRLFFLVVVRAEGDQAEQRIKREGN